MAGRSILSRSGLLVGPAQAQQPHWTFQPLPGSPRAVNCLPHRQSPRAPRLRATPCLRPQVRAASVVPIECGGFRASAAPTLAMLEEVPEPGERSFQSALCAQETRPTPPPIPDVPSRHLRWLHLLRSVSSISFMATSPFPRNERARSASDAAHLKHSRRGFLQC